MLTYILTRPADGSYAQSNLRSTVFERFLFLPQHTCTGAHTLGRGLQCFLQQGNFDLEHKSKSGRTHRQLVYYSLDHKLLSPFIQISLFFYAKSN